MEPISDMDALLVAYADGELDPEQAREVERQLATDPEARRSVELFQSTASLLRAACGEHGYASATVALPASNVTPLRRRSLVGRRDAWIGAAALAACAVGFAGGMTWAGRPPDARQALLDEVVSYHAVYARETTPLDQAPPERAGEIAVWLGRRLGRQLEVPDFASRGLSFAGARLLVVDGKHVAQLMYNRPQGLPIGLCIARFEGKASLETERHGSQWLAAWQDGALLYVVVGELAEDEVRAIAGLAARQLTVEPI